MVAIVESADIRSQHGESWRLINEISGRMTAQKGILKGKSTKERLDNWQKHFSELLGKEPVVPEESVNEVIDTVLSPEELKKYSNRAFHYGSVPNSEEKNKYWEMSRRRWYNSRSTQILRSR